ncbi:helix-turn-helix transcriptional regulator [Micromonospora sp. CPCC 206060]|uniref:helix-turn-helix transcriptional regulator n=1 Tax=Micromonospora sp. CPCC 206060 TaxID=3122406 RepID=UPI002FF3ABAC
MANDLDITQVYLLLHSGPPYSPEEIAEALDGELASVHRCLDLLGETGMLRPSSTPGRLTVIRPEVGITVLLSRVEANAARAARHAPTTTLSMTEREREVLRLLAQGYTDESVARSLGVSLRTARRIAADLMVRLGARSRFQAGLMVSRVLADQTRARQARPWPPQATAV